MNHLESTFMIDRLVTLVRWMSLIGLSLSLAIQGSFPLSVQIILICAAVWNSLLSLMAIMNRRLASHTLVSLVGDLIIINLLFGFSGAFGGPLIWAGVLPVITSALYFGSKGVIIITLMNLATHGAQGFIFGISSINILKLVTTVLVFLGIGGIINLLNIKLMDALKNEHKKLIQEITSSKQVERDWLQTFIGMALDLGKNTSFRSVHESLLDLSIAALKAPTVLTKDLIAGIFKITDDEQGKAYLTLVASRNDFKKDTKLSLPDRGSFIGYAISDGEPRLFKDGSKDAVVSQIELLSKCRSFYCVPMRNDAHIYGIILYAHPDEEFFTPEYRQIFDLIGSRVMQAIEQVRVSQYLVSDRNRLLEINVRSRKMVARELHDGVTQAIAALAMRINIARRLSANPSQALVAELDKVEELARKTTKEMRYLLFSLHPSVLETQDLTAALTDLVQKMSESFNQEVSLSIEPEIIPTLDKNSQVLIFDICVEAVNNARKHADAEHIWVRLRRFTENTALLEIEDDGIGFELTKLNEEDNNPKNLGLLNLREYVHLMQGDLEIESEQGKGTLIQSKIPINPQAGEGQKHNA